MLFFRYFLTFSLVFLFVLDVGLPAIPYVYQGSSQTAFAQEDQPKKKKRKKRKKKKRKKKRKPQGVVDFSDLEDIAEFQDIAVIQRRFLPKTERIQIYTGLTTITNDAFFINYGFVGRASYNFIEALGIELLYFGLITSQRDVTVDLSANQSVSTASLVTPQRYMGANLQWSPFYGKYSLIDRAIIPFDLYLTGGAGITTTNQGDNSLTYHFGTGQIFALSKSFAFRWDFTLNSYEATSTINRRNINGQITSSESFSQSVYNLFLTVGVSLFFPEAEYR